MLILGSFLICNALVNFLFILCILFNYKLQIMANGTAGKLLLKAYSLWKLDMIILP